jgi:serine/threonine protein kinase
MESSGPYILVSRLGEGGMAEVFKAYKQGPEGWKKPIALKRILPQFADHQVFIQMLSAEARLHAHLEHPNIVQILDFFRHGESFVMALEYVPGKNIRMFNYDAQRKGVEIPWEAWLHVCSETLKGLDYAHKRRGPDGPLGIVHRDVSPQNILVSYDGHVKLSDFGIAMASIEREKTASGVLKGKHRYLAAEQLEKGSVSSKTDLFSMGVVLYELLGGQHPFANENDFQVMKQITKGEYVPLDQIRKDLPEGVVIAISQALSRNPDDRQIDAHTFRRQLLAHQKPEWLTQGSDILARLLEEVYPKGDAREDTPIEKTPILSREGSPLPIELKPGESLIAGPTQLATSPPASFIALRRRRYAPYVVVGGLLLGSWVGWRGYQHFVLRPSPPPQNIAAVAPVAPTPEPTTPPATITPISQIEPTAPMRPKKASRPTATTGSLSISGPDRAAVFLNGRKVGVLPFAAKIENLRAGDYVVSIKPDRGAIVNRTLRVRAGQTTFFSVASTNP